MLYVKVGEKTPSVAFFQRDVEDTHTVSSEEDGETGSLRSPFTVLGVPCASRGLASTLLRLSIPYSPGPNKAVDRVSMAFVFVLAGADMGNVTATCASRPVSLGNSRYCAMVPGVCGNFPGSWDICELAAELSGRAEGLKAGWSSSVGSRGCTAKPRHKSIDRIRIPRFHSRKRC